jgi:hypothetical protein
VYCRESWSCAGAEQPGAEKQDAGEEGGEREAELVEVGEEVEEAEGEGDGLGRVMHVQGVYSTGTILSVRAKPWIGRGQSWSCSA